MCATLLPPTFKLGEFSLLVGGFKCITAVDAKGDTRSIGAGANPEGIADLYLHYKEKWRQDGKPGGVGFGSFPKYVLKKGAVKKSDVTKYGNLKYTNIPNVINDVCE